MTFRHTLLVTTCFFILASVAGCGEGSSNSSGNNSNGSDSGLMSSGIFIDAAVSGLEYEINGERYLTDENGSFKFEPNRSVSFFIGDIFLGSAVGGNIITPLDLVPEALDETDNRVLNRLRFLQTLDNDANLANGITISESTRMEAKGKSLAFNQQKEDFANSSTRLISELTSATSGGSRVLVSETSALAHFRTSLTEISSTESIEALDGEVISEEKANQILFNNGVGHWRLDYSSDQSFEYSGVSLRSIGRYRRTYSVYPDMQKVGYCGTAGFDNPYITISSDEFLNQIGSKLVQSCTDNSYVLKRMANGGLGYEYFCNGEISMAGVFEKISSDTEPNFGSLVINTADLPDIINISAGICGALGTLKAIYTYPEPLPNGEIIDTHSEYQWEANIWSENQNEPDMYLNIEGKPTHGTYFVGDSRVDSLPGATLYFSKETDTLIAKSGTVTVTGISLYSLSGSFDALTETGNEMTGSFSINMRR